MIDIKISVRNLIEFVHRYGDIVSGGMGTSPSRLEEGTRAHVKIQKERQKEDISYEKEQYFKYQIAFEDILFIVDGRADGIVRGRYIEEIKSTYAPLEDIDEDYNRLYWAQVMFYGFMYMEEEKKANVLLLLTYFNLDTETTKTFERNYTYEELKNFVSDTIEEYLKYTREDVRWKKERNESLRTLPFPFMSYRLGQRDLAVDVYRTLRQGGKLFAKAPTGIGKTISTLFPAIKAIGEGEADRVFYLTAKGTLKTVAEESVEIIRKKGGKVKFLTITSKEKICINDEINCNPDKCTFAEGHYDRINACILDILRNERSYSKEMIIEYAKRYRVCPFELSLDLSYFSDLIICDYNYVFDPKVYLRRFFMDVRENYIFLVDEAHNLVDRSRDMYSASLSKELVMEAKKAGDRFSYLKRSLTKINKKFIEMRKTLEEKGGKHTYFGVSDDLIFLLKDFLQSFEIFQKEVREDFEGRDKILDLFFAVHSFLNISEIYNEGYLTYEETAGSNVIIKLFCIYPRDILIDVFKRAKASILFSATLAPMNYYFDVLGGEEGDYRKSLGSPFPKENLEVYQDRNIDTRFTKREESFEGISENIHEMARRRKGNYIAFFPSYKYMRDVHALFMEKYGNEYDIYIQEPNLGEKERDDVLSLFYQERDRSFISFMVLGGIFSEGIDLQGEALIGASVVGVGYPQVSYERDLIKEYFARENLGFEYAYIYPGINRVLQAAGRVIRSESDQGQVLLMDLRYSWAQYKNLLPPEWQPLMDWNERESR
ncbi:ATP-dependent DNA helicase [Proteiniclasticum sp.]|uniref:ATP-dependent DNA helicase n=1 Tax=Proteiniclasticum sp. TaxID=2053595 RepID=UPI00289CB834|nr:ATP-dependent DNA helicase [Proteiniclasticum sp.]